MPQDMTYRSVPPAPCPWPGTPLSPMQVAALEETRRDSTPTPRDDDADRDDASRRRTVEAKW